MRQPIAQNSSEPHSRESTRMSAMNSIRALLILAVVAAFGTAAGCGSSDTDVRDAQETETDHAPARAARAHAVAEAWDGSNAAEAWREGYYPMGEAIQLPAGGLREGADQRALELQNFVLQGELPKALPEAGAVTWRRGGSVRLPLLGASSVFKAMGRGGAGHPRLTVTGAKLGGMTIATSRGPAEVPAWLFTLRGYQEPLKRTAVVPSKLPDPPIPPAGQMPAGELQPLQRLTEVAENGRVIKVLASHGSCDSGPSVDVWETSGSVVLSAYISDSSDGPCSSELRSRAVTVTLDKPVGDRVLLDAHTGRPVSYGEPDAPSPSWS